ncbi:hypothetical protein [Pseudoalteromonas xiamenensis]
MKARFGTVLLVIVAIVAFGTALSHLSCLYFGPQCYAAQMAPPVLVESAKAGTLLAPFATLVASAIFVVCGCYALSGAKIVRRLPLLNVGIYVIALVSILRGVLTLQLWARHPELVSLGVLTIGLIWFCCGLCYLVGYRAVNAQRNDSQVSYK